GRGGCGPRIPGGPFLTWGARFISCRAWPGVKGPQPQGLGSRDLEGRSARILLESLEVQTDIGFHEFEVGAPQRLLVTIEIWLDDVSMPKDDDPARAWNYDFLRTEVEEIASDRRYNLQETLAHAIFARIA